MITSDERAVTKDFSISKKATIVLKEQTSILNPIITLAYDESLLNCNYCYIKQLKRYYYIKNIVIGYNQALEMELYIDVLMSWKSYILSLNCFIQRQEYNYNPYFVDGELLTRADKTQIIQNVGSVGGDNTIRYYLTTTGGN